jgi:hypothetical protein
MNIDRISYKKVFPIGSYLTEHIGLEATLDTGESPEVALQRLQIIVNDLHSATIATLEETRGTQVKDISPVDATIAGIIEDINASTVLSEQNFLGVEVGLAAYLPMTEKFPEIKAAYMKKFNELTNNK